MRYIRTVTTVGNSMAVTIPRDIIEAEGIKKGDRVLVDIKKEKDDAEREAAE